MVVMAIHSFGRAAFLNFENLVEKSRGGAVILLSLALMVVPVQPALGQINQQQQEQQQREQQAREQQQREQQERDQRAREEQQRQEQQREQQAREQQQREQQREQQAREQQQREQQERDQRAREEQQRQEQQREQQAREEQQRQEQQREQQVRDQQQRAEQERQRKTSNIPVNPSATGSHPLSQPLEAASQRANPPTQTPEPDRRITASATDARTTAARNQNSRSPESDLRRPPCDKQPCAEPAPKPVPPEVHTKLCKDGPCPVCAPGQSPGKNNSCVPSALAKGTAAPPNPAAAPQACPGGQIWNGIQCVSVGVQQCSPGQTRVSAICQADCTSSTAGAQSYIELLRMARQDKDSACLKDPTGPECRIAGVTYDMRLNEYRGFLGGVPSTCTLPDPISI